MWFDKCCIFLLCVTACYCIAEEYYEDINEEVSTSTVAVLVKNNNTIARRTGQKLQGNLSFVLNSIRNSANIDEADSNDDELKIFVINQRKLENLNDRQSLKHFVINNISSSPKWTVDNVKTDSKSIKSTTMKLGVNFFKDYEYVYDDETSRQPYKFDQTRTLRTTKSSTVPVINSSKNLYTDFFNLVPAVIKPDNNQTFLPMKERWYVPESYPCWQMPVLYGELGKNFKNTSEIFITYGANLKNVMTQYINNHETLNTYDLPPTVSHNKWCEVEPCYGDHTLCLFSKSSNSKICDYNYLVKGPNTLEEIALVNTVNAMRNRIASGVAEDYQHLPPARNMKQMLYDHDLENMASTWLRQCLPGPPPCSALEGQYVTQLECTKYAEKCCVSYKDSASSKCIPKDECFVPAIIGCIYAWFLSAGDKLRQKEVDCGHVDASTYNTAQLIWANTNKIGCAYGERPNGDVRVVCNFAPGAPFFIVTKYFCGLISHKDITPNIDDNNIDWTNLTLVSSIGLNLNRLVNPLENASTHYTKVSDRALMRKTKFKKSWSLEGLRKLYTNAQLREIMKDSKNVTRAMIARLVTRYTFYEESQSKCDSDEPIYIVGEPGSLCVERGRRFHALCYDFRDPSPGYRLVAVLAPAALFSLILYDLFSGVVRQTNY